MQTTAFLRSPINIGSRDRLRSLRRVSCVHFETEHHKNIVEAKLGTMPNIAAALKEEIARVARKEIKSQTDPFKKAGSQYRTQIAALRKRVEQLERQLKRAIKTRPAPEPQEGQEEGNYRWRPEGFATHRQRLGLSAADMGKLVGASSLAVYKWESGKVRPRARFLPAIAEVRKIGKREAMRRLERLAV